MLDIKYIREHEEDVRSNLARRKDTAVLRDLDEVIELDKKLRCLQKEGDLLRKRRNSMSKEINTARKHNKDITSLREEVKALPLQIKKNEEAYDTTHKRLHQLLLRIPNMMHESVPYGVDDTENQQVSTQGEKPVFTFTPRSHVDIIKERDYVDLFRAAKISGARWYFLAGKLALLEMALCRYGVDFMRERGFTLIIPPAMMRREAFEGVTSLEDFEDVLYKTEDHDLYLIPTSEHPLTAMYMNEVLENDTLPIKTVGISPCFRKEAGSHGKDTKGIFRVHQFNKVEQIVLCKPEDSWTVHEQLRKNGEDFFTSLGLHTQTVNICTGDLGIVAAKKYDVEVWMPVQQKYREVISCSNCTSYQSNRLNISYMNGQEKIRVHTLNATVVATARALVAILENFQNEDGTVRVPEVLHKYTGFTVLD